MRDPSSPTVTVTLTESDDPAVQADWDDLWDFLCDLVLDPEPEDEAPPTND